MSEFLILVITYSRFMEFGSLYVSESFTIKTDDYKNVVEKLLDDFSAPYLEHVNGVKCTAKVYTSSWNGTLLVKDDLIDEFSKKVSNMKPEKKAYEKKSFIKTNMQIALEKAGL